ncbi:MAG: DoxX family protein [Planctomycetes bacterium]|nr:DoxX family protein [Planctomycetota bacterium]MCW8134148.1 DoxX family protein [Planctomycetota bacterium]
MNELTERLLRAIGVLILRVGAGVLMMTHGWGKVKRMLDGNWEFADPIGLGPTLSLIAVAGAEFVCAGMVVVGLLTRAAAAPVVFAMLIAAFVIHANDPWVRQEMPLLFALMFFVLMWTGGGRFSLDALMWPALKRRRAKAKV